MQARQETAPHVVRPDATLTAHGLVDLLHHGQQEAASPGRRIEDMDVIAGQAVMAAKMAAQQRVHAAHDVADDRLRREVDAALLAHDRVVRGEEILVEMHDGVALPRFAAEIAHDLGDLRVGQTRRQLLDGPLHLTLQVLEDLPEFAVQEAIGARHVGEGARQREIARGQVLQLHAGRKERVGQGLGVHVGEFAVVQFGQQFDFQIVLVLVQEAASVGRVERLADQVGDFARQVGHDPGQILRRGDVGRRRAPEALQQRGQALVLLALRLQAAARKTRDGDGLPGCFSAAIPAKLAVVGEDQVVAGPEIALQLFAVFGSVKRDVYVLAFDVADGLAGQLQHQIGRAEVQVARFVDDLNAFVEGPEQAFQRGTVTVLGGHAAAVHAAQVVDVVRDRIHS